MVDLVKASITGSILGNLLLVLGAAQLAGGLKIRNAEDQSKAGGAQPDAVDRRRTGSRAAAIFQYLHPDPAR
jgi:Ca2+:H+ antiporter